MVSELAKVVPPTCSCGRSIRYSNILYDFSVTICRCYKDVYPNSFFSCLSRLWNALPAEWFPLTYDLNGLNKSRVNRHFLSLGSL